MRLKVTLIGCLMAVLGVSNLLAQDASVQIIHNSPDPGAEAVDIYVAGELLLDDFEFRQATPFTAVPSGVEIEVAVAPSSSAGVADAIATFTIGPLAAGGSYQAIATGVLDPTAFPANPEGLETAFTILTDTALTAADPGNPGPQFVSVRAVHNVPDAPTISALIPQLNNFALIADLPYNQLTPYQPVTATAFQVNIVPSDDTLNVLASFVGDISGLEGQAVTLLASGFVDGSVGPDFSIIAVLADGTVVPLAIPTSVRAINGLTDDNVAILNAGGADLASGDMDAAVKSQLQNKTVFFTAVLMSDPLNSGLATGPIPARVHVFVRDTLTSVLGPEGMGMQIVDGNYEANGTLGLLKGDVINVVGVVSYFFNTVQLIPISITPVGNYADLGLPDSILDPVVVTTSDMNKTVGDNAFQANWDNFGALNNQFIKIEDATVLTRTSGDRVDWSITSEVGASAVWIYDTSLRYRNDQSSYPDNFNARDEDFIAPPPGAIIDLSGFVTFNGDDPAGVATPGFSLFGINPMEDGDLVVKEAPPQITMVASSDSTAGADPITISATVTPDPNRTLASTVLAYSVSDNPDVELEIDMTDNGDGTFSAEIPAQADGTFVSYSIVSTDNTGSATTEGPFSYRVLLDGINSIEDVQLTFDGGQGPSPFNGVSTAMDITGWVNSKPGASGFLVVQDGTGPWSGVLVEYDSTALGFTLTTGDSVRITAGTISEIRGIRFDRQGELTGIGAPTIEMLGAGTAPGYLTVTTATLQDPGVAEAHEGMMLRFENVAITNNDFGFGEWLFADIGSAEGENELVGDDAASGVAGGPELFQPWSQVASLQGVWSDSFGSMKLMPEEAGDVGEVLNVSNENLGDGIPNKFTLDQNYPNPFNPVTTIQYNVGASTQVTLDIFDITGRRISTLVNERLAAGAYTATFDASNLATGTYMYRLIAGDQVITRKMTLVR